MWQRFDPTSTPSTPWDTFQCSPRQAMAAVVWAAALLLVAATAERRAVEAADAITASVFTWRVPYFSDGPGLVFAEDGTPARGFTR